MRTTLQKQVCAAAVALVLGVALGGCSSTIDQIPTSLGGLPEGVPQRPAVPPAYPAVHDMPAAREERPLTPEQRKALQEDLKRTRDRQTNPDAETTSAAPRGGAGAPRAP